MKLFYRVQGEGRPLIIIHGLFGSSDNWLTLSKQLANDYKVYLIDQRNHGRSPHSPVFTYDAMSEDLLTFIHDHGLVDPIVLGHSMGGKTAMYAAVRAPDTIGKLIVVDIAPKSYPVHHAAILKGLQAIMLDKLQTRQEADSLLSHYVVEPDVRQFLLKNLYRTDDLQFKWRMNLPVIAESIEQIGVEVSANELYRGPSLFVRGDNSQYVQPDDALLIKKIFPLAIIETIPQAGHWVQVDAPVAFFECINKFIKLS